MLHSYLIIKIIGFIKSVFFYFKIKFYKNKINKIINKIIDNNTNNNKIASLLLAAGTSSRFKNSSNSDILKQIYLHNNKSIISYSIENISQYSEYIIIITNTNCYDKIVEIIDKFHYYIKNKIIILINDFNCRLESIGVGLDYIKNNLKNINKILIHDSARPFVPKNYIKNIIDNTIFYSQYSLNLTNGLIDNNYNTLDRDNYIEICSPICINYELCIFIYENFIEKKNRHVYEFIDILKIYKIEMNFIYGKYNYLKKITTIDDLNN